MKHEIVKVDATPLARADSLPAIIEAAGDAARFAYEQYFLSEEEYRGGRYERKVSFYGPKFGPWLVQRFSALAK